MSFGIVIQHSGPANVLLVAEAAAVKPIPVAQMIYATGDYAHACACHKAAQEWAETTGAATKDGLRVVINRPHHPESPASSRIAPCHLMDEAAWNLTVDFYCGPETLEWLQSLPIPLGAGLLVIDALVISDTTISEEGNPQP